MEQLGSDINQNEMRKIVEECAAKTKGELLLVEGRINKRLDQLKTLIRSTSEGILGVNTVTWQITYNPWRGSFEGLVILLDGERVLLNIVEVDVHSYINVISSDITLLSQLWVVV